MNEAKMIRLCLLGLPLGLIVLGAASLAIHFSGKDQDGVPAVFNQLASEIQESDLQVYVRNLSEVIGPRHLEKEGTLNRTANHLESTWGPENFGYRVERQEFEIDGRLTRNIWIDLPGGDLRNEVICVTAHYDHPLERSVSSNEATGAAALLALAQNFIGERPDRTIRFAALTNGTPPHGGTENGGAFRLASIMKSKGDQVRAVLCLDGLGSFPKTALSYSPEVERYFAESGGFLVIAGIEENADLIRKASESLSLTVPTIQVGIESSEIASLASHDFRSFHQLGFPTILVSGNGRFSTESPNEIDWPIFTETVQDLATVIRSLANS